jgi:very-short-patch-repair endonuclease
VTRKANLPKPLPNHEIAGRRRDFAWPDQRLVVETDGYRYHSSRAAKRRDNRRDRQLTALGWRTVRFTYEEVAFEPGVVGAEVAQLLRNARTAAT